MFHISIATAEDAAEILALQRLAYESEARLYNDWSIPPLAQTLESLIADIKVATVLKAVEGPSIIGSVRASLAGDVCLIGRLMVDPARQGRGNRRSAEEDSLLTRVGAAAPSAASIM